MELLRTILSSDPATPRLTVYNESTGARLDFSAQTLDNWAAKVANMLREELDLEQGSLISLELPASWQCVAIVLGAMAAGIDVEFCPIEQAQGAVVFMDSERIDASPAFSGDVVLVTQDPFGRGVVECGGTVPDGMIDFGPTVRFYGDQFFEPGTRIEESVDKQALAAITPGARALSTGWTTLTEMERTVLAPLAAVGSAVVVTGVASDQRLDAIGRAEKATIRLS
ncbi:TIGR03089 family protein [Corynebacterium ulcerans]|uniref:TIGR03089 family protein n=1 Tax=Corynebacterium ulcerans TaxID=65058 RepID=UPI0018D83345|nr:TIGR03089 family protein [Corynebacterium ulcerans]MBH5297113.1 TIGR03089 family protein [Corynebacterium ulcerans]